MCSLVNFLSKCLAVGSDAYGLRQPRWRSTVHASGDDKHAMINSGYHFFANSFRRRAIFFTASHAVFESEQHSPTGRMTCTNWDSSSLLLGLAPISATSLSDIVCGFHVAGRCIETTSDPT